MGAASGCVASTAGDMAIFARYLIGLAQGKGGPVLHDDTAARFIAVKAQAPGWAPDAEYGNGIARLSDTGVLLWQDENGKGYGVWGQVAGYRVLDARMVPATPS